MLKELVHHRKKPSVVKSVRIPKDLIAEIQSKADIYAGGNICAWLRYAGIHFKPSKKELINVEAE